MDNYFYVKTGNKVLRSFSLFMDKEEKLEKAMVHYKKALSEFIENQDFLNYSILSEKIGDEYFKINDIDSAQKQYENAQKHYLTLDIDKYFNITINKIIPLYIKNNNIKNIGKAYCQLAKLTACDKEHEKTIDYYQKAVSYLETEKCYDLLNCYTDFTYYLLNYGDIDSASYYIKLIIKYMADSNLLVYKANEYIFMFLLCVMSKNDTILVKKKIAKYCDMVHRFNDSAYCKLIENLNETYENNNIDKFSDLIYEYDKLYKLKPHEVKLLLNIKKNIISNNEVDLR